MKRRHFLQLGTVGLGALSLGAFSLPSFADTAPLALPEKLQNNPLLRFDNLPNFADVKPKHVKPAIDYLLAYNKEVVQYVSHQNNPTWSNFYLPLEDAQNKLERAWHIVSHLHSVKNSDELRKAYNESQTPLTEYSTWVGMYRPLYDGFVKLKNSQEYQSYNQAQKQAIDNALRDFELSGIALNEKDAKRYGEIVARLSKLSTQFSNNVLDAVAGYELIVDNPDELSGLTEHALQAAAASAKDKGKKGYRFTLDYPSYSAVAKYADNRNLRAKLYEAYLTRASDQGPNAGKWDNTAIIDEILALRFERANLLGYPTYADYALATRMAQSPSEVLEFLNTILDKARPKAVAEIDELAILAKEYNIDKLEPWDVNYLSEKQRLKLYDIDQETLRPYFPEDTVLSGMFEFAKRVFGINIQEKSPKEHGIKVWHDDVRFFEIYKDNQLVASFYLDLYARENKCGGAWMNGAIDRKTMADGSIQLPVAHLVCNFSKPVDGKPSLLLHDEVNTLFHEFGHGLHHMLTAVNVMAVSGINGVAWDAVEFPSQLFENWTWDKDALTLISSHHQDKTPLPDEMINKLIAAKNYHAARLMVRQLEFGLFDFRLNTEYRPDNKDMVASLRDDIKQNVSVLTEPEWTRMAHAFTHIFSGGYAAGYYSYLWADVLASDAFTRFAQEGIFNAQTGQDYLDAFLSQGGSDKPMNLFVKFMGRKPDTNALLRSQGII